MSEDQPTENSQSNPEQTQDRVFKNIAEAFQNNNPAEAQKIFEAYMSAEQTIHEEELQKSFIKGARVAIDTALHEINTPLSQTVGYADMLMEDVPNDLPPHFKGDLEKILKGAQLASDQLSRLAQIRDFTPGEFGGDGKQIFNINQRPKHEDQIFSDDDPLT